MSKEPTPKELICEAGRCSCGTRIVRGLDNTHELVSVDIWAADAATELIAWRDGRASYVLDLARPTGMTLTRRTTTDIKRRPAGFKRDRIVLTHACRKGTP